MKYCLIPRDAIFSRIGFVSWPNTGPYTAKGVFGPVLGQLYITYSKYNREKERLTLK